MKKIVIALLLYISSNILPMDLQEDSFKRPRDPFLRDKQISIQAMQEVVSYIEKQKGVGSQNTVLLESIKKLKSSIENSDMDFFLDALPYYNKCLVITVGILELTARTQNGDANFALPKEIYTLLGQVALINEMRPEEPVAKKSRYSYQQEPQLRGDEDSAKDESILDLIFNMLAKAT